MERLMTALLELTLPMALVIAVLLAAGPLLGRRFTAKWRYWAWLLIAVRLLLPVGITLPQPVVTLPQPQGEFTYPVSREEPAPTEPAPVGDPIQVVPGAAENDPYQQIETGTTAPTGPSTETPKPAEPAITPTPAGTRSIPVMEAVGWCWAAGTALFLLWQLGSYLALRAKLSRSRRPLTDEAILAVLERESATAGRQKPLPVYTAAVGSPMIVGAIKPTLLLPELELSTEQLSLVFRHELIHYRRRDIWYKLLLMLANAIHWFNPMVWLMVHAADRDLELSCDEAVVAGRDEAYREEYGRCLLAVVRAGMNRRTLFTTNFYSGKKTLKNRLATIFDTTKKHRGTLALAALLTVPLGGIFGFLIGKLLNKMKGQEMIGSMILGYFANGLYQLLFLFIFDNIIPIHNPNLTIKGSKGIANTMDLSREGGFAYSLEKLWQLPASQAAIAFAVVAALVLIVGYVTSHRKNAKKLGVQLAVIAAAAAVMQLPAMKNLFSMVNVPMATFGVVALLCLFNVVIMRTRLGQQFRAVGQNGVVANAAGIDVDRVRIIAIVFSTILAGWGQLIFVQNMGSFQTYGAHEQVGLYAGAAILVGGASVIRATNTQALVGCVLFHLMFILAPAAGKNLFGDAAIGEYFRVFICYGVIALSLVMHAWSENNRRKQAASALRADNKA